MAVQLEQVTTCFTWLSKDIKPFADLHRGAEGREIDTGRTFRWDGQRWEVYWAGDSADGETHRLLRTLIVESRRVRRLLMVFVPGGSSAMDDDENEGV